MVERTDGFALGLRDPARSRSREVFASKAPLCGWAFHKC